MSSIKEEYFACLALRHTPGIGPRTWAAILNHYHGAYEAVKDSSNWPVLNLASEKCAENASRELWRPKAESEYREAMREGFGILPWTHPVFPSALKEIPDPPAYLYYYGNPSLLSNPAVAVVGSRKSSRLGLDYARRISRDLSAKGITVVSGFARGIDSCVHRAALGEVGSSIAVLGTGLDIDDYPADSGDLRSEMIDSGLILSEFPPGTRPYANNFPFRNRIISGLCVGVLVVEADIASGSLITARLAAEQGREVMAMPGPLGDKCFSGCLRLIKDGAALVETADDVLLNIRHVFDSQGNVAVAPRAVKPSISQKSVQRQSKNNVLSPQQPVEVAVDISGLEPPECDIANIIADSGRLHIDEIAFKTGVPVPVLSASLVGMEVKGIVVRFPGMYYDLKRC
ncbi:DNA-processing protein DprA [Maridesulfovibrio sp. FT414]|uniref:DNA-processing protein DprA n=1 Tax=Maridesulfovibrio sp. FT414 TaxID=2979469 RepID=UPI003D805725